MSKGRCDGVWTYLLRRLALAVPTILGASLLVFLMVRMLPGDPVDQVFGENAVAASDKDALRRELGLDQPVYEQYVRWLGKLAQGDLGRSMHSDAPIRDELTRRLPPTIELGVIAITTGLLAGVSIGMISAIRRNSFLDLGGRTFAILLLVIPSFWLGTLAIIIPAKLWHWAPPFIYKSLWDDPATNLQQVGFAALLLGIHTAGGLMRFTRTALLEVLNEDYVRTARAKGLAPRLVYIRHAVRNALMPIITIIGLQVPLLVGGTVIMEQLFAIPGVGQYFMAAIGGRDYPVIQAVNMMIAVVVIASNLVVDLAYSAVDPRTRLSA